MNRQPVQQAAQRAGVMALVAALVMVSGATVAAERSGPAIDDVEDARAEADDARAELERELQAALFGDSLPASADAALAAPGDIEAPVIVTAIVDQETMAQVTLEWTDVDALGKFAVFRDDVEVAQTTGPPTFTESIPIDETYEYAVRSLDGETVGETSVALLKLDRDCDLIWTGSVGNDFADAGNWAPFGAPPAAPRAPSATDHICIDTLRNTPVTSSGSNAFFDQATSALDPATPLLDVAAGDLTAATSIEKLPVVISGGTLSTKGLAEFTTLALNAGTLDLGANVTVTRPLTVGAGNTTIQASDPAVLQVLEMNLTDADLTMSGPVQVAGFMARLDGDSTIVDGLTPGATIATELIEASSGKAEIDVRVSGELTVTNDADLTVTKHDALTNDEVMPRVAVQGSLTLTQPATRFGGLSIEGSTSTVNVNSGTNVFAGVTNIDTLYLFGNVDVSVPNDVTFESVELDASADLTVGGTLTWSDDLSVDDSTITANEFTSSAVPGTGGTLNAIGADSRLKGDVTLLSDVYIGSSDAPIDSILVVDGNLQMGPDTDVAILLRDGIESRIDVTGTAVLDGAFDVFVGDELEPGQERTLFTWGSSTGSVTALIRGNGVTPDTTIEQRANAVVVARGGGALQFEQVTALGITLAPDDATVALAWPPAPGAVSYEISAAGDVVASVGTTTATVDAKPDQPIAFTVTAVDGVGARTDLGTLALAIPAIGDCSVTWSGAVDDDWGVPLNWVPVATAPAVPSTPSVPLVGHDVCIDVATNLPVIVDDIDVDHLSVTSDLAPSDGVVVDISSSDFLVGLLSVPTFRVDDTFLVADEVDADRIVLSSTTINALTVGVRRIEHVGSAATSKESEILAGVDVDVVDIAAGTKLTIGQLDDPGGAALVVRGDVQIDKPISNLRGLSLLGNDATIVVDSGPANVLDGVASIDTVTLEEIDDFSVVGDLTIGALSIEDSGLLASDDLTIVRSLDAADGNEVVADDITFGPTATVRLVVRPPSQFTMVRASGNMTLAGTLEVDVRGPMAGIPPIPLFGWGTATGSFTTTLVGPNAAGAEIVRDSTGVRLQAVPDAVDDVIARGIRIDGPARTATVSLAWPNTPGAVRYEVRVGGGVVTSTTSTTATVAATIAAAAAYRVFAIDDKDAATDLGAISLYVPAPGACSVTWTGRVDSDWKDADNWVPVVDVPAVLPAASAPANGDHVCIDMATNLPVDATDVEIEPAAVSSRLVAANGLALDIDSSTFEVAGAVTLPGLRIDDSFLFAADVAAGRIVMSSATIAASTVTATRIEHLDLSSPTTQSNIDATVTAATIDIAKATRLDITKLDDTGNTTFVIEGAATVAQPFTQLAGLNLEAAGASITLGANVANLLTGVTEIDTLSLDSIDELSVANDLTVGALTTVDSGLFVDDLLTIERSLNAADGNEVLATDIVFETGVLVRVVVRPPNRFTRISASNSIVLAGSLEVDLRASLVQGTILPLIEWDTATGTIGLDLVGDADAIDTAELVRTANRIVVQTKNASACGPAPDTADMAVTGCWTDEGDGTYRTTDSQSPDGVAIGGLDIDLDAGTVLVLDPDGPSIAATDASGAPADVTLSVPVGDKASPLATLTLGRLDLGAWNLGDGLALPMEKLFGIDLGGSPSLTATGGGWDLSFNVELPGILRGISLLDVPIGAGGIDPADLSMENLDGVFAEVFQALELDVRWINGNVWRFESIVPDGPSITGDIDFRELNGGGTLVVRNLEVEELVRVPDFDLTGVFNGGRHTWVLDVPEPSTLRRFGFTYTTAGDLVEGALLLGDAPGEDKRNSVVSWGDWLDVDRLDIRFDTETETFSIDGELSQPAVAITGVYRADKTTGATEFVSIGIDGAEIGALATFDIDLIYDGTAGTYAVTAAIAAGTGPGNTAINGSGTLTFDDGDLTAGSVVFDELRVGEVATIDDFAFTYVGASRTFALGGTITTETSPGPITVAGTADFDAGRLRTATLSLDGLVLGPVVLDDFDLSISLPSGQDRTTAVQLSGSVRNRVAGDRLTTTPISGSAVLDSGRLQSFQLTVGTIDIGGFAHLEQTTLGYTFDSGTGTAQLMGSGRLVTADGATSVGGSIDLTLRDGDVLSARITSDRLSFGGAVTISDFDLAYDPDDKGPCEGLTAPSGAISWAASGNVTVGGAPTDVSGCLIIVGRRLVAGNLSVGSIRLGSLATFSDLVLTVSSVQDLSVTDLAGAQRTISRTDFSLAANVAIGTGSPIAVAGSMAVSNGGLVSLQLAIPDLPVANVAQLRNLSFSYTAGAPWDATADTSFKLEGEVVSSNSITALSGAITFDAAGNLTALSFDAENVDFGASRIDVLSFVYEGAQPDTRWRLEGSVTAGGRTFALNGAVELVNGRVEGAEFSIGSLPIGDIALIENLEFQFRRNADGSERWSGGGRVGVGDRDVAATLGFTFAPSGALTAGEVTVERLEWSEALVFDDFRLDYRALPNSTTWDVSGSVAIDGEPTTLSGSLALQAGRVTSGSMSVTNLRLGQLATVEELSLTAAVTPTSTTWAASLALAGGAEGSGSMQWIDGQLHSATLVLRDLVIGQLVTIQNVGIVYSSQRWAATGTVQNDGRASTLGGDLIFDNGRLVGGTLSATGFRFGSITLDDFQLVIGDSVDFGGEVVSVGAVCGKPDPGGAGERWGISARVTSGSGETGELGGRVRFDKGNLTEGVVCAENITIADFVTIETFNVSMTSTATTETWSGTLELSNPNDGARPFGGSFEFTLVDRRLQAATVTATRLRLSSVLDFEPLTLTYDGVGTFDEWTLDGELKRAGGNETIGGSLTVDQGRIVGASFDASKLDFGNVVSFEDVSIEYVGRRAPTNPPSETAGQGTWDSLPVSGCAATPNGPNVPSGVPTTSGAESYFSVAATVTRGGQTIAAAGSFGLVGGRMTTFDVSLSCLPLGDWITLEDVRVALTAQGTILVGARIADDDATRPDPVVRGLIQLAGGRVVGGALSLRDVSLGAAVIETLDITLGQQPDGTSTWGLAAKVRNKDGQLVEGGGSVTMRNGRIVGGSLTLPELPLLEIVPVRNVSVSFFQRAGTLVVSGSASFVKRNGDAGASVAIELGFSSGKLVSGSFSASNLKIFNVIPIGLISVSFDPGDPTAPDDPGPRWSGSLAAQAPNRPSSGVQLGIEVANGRVVSGLIGFGSNGVVAPLNPDGKAPAEGEGAFAGLPLKAFYLRFCSANSSVAFCLTTDEDGDGVADGASPVPFWEGRLKIQLPTDDGPALDGQIRIVDGRFAGASLYIDFGPGIPVFAGVYLKSIGASIELNPRLRFCGTVGANVGVPGGLAIASITGTITFSEEFEGIDLGLGERCELPLFVSVPEDRDPDYLRFLVRADAELFPGNPLGIRITGSGYVDLQTRGYLGVGAAIDLAIWKQTLFVRGQVDGSLFNASNVTAFNPETGDRLSGVQAQLRGGVGLFWKRTELVGASFVINTVGFAGCGRVAGGLLKLGGGGYWSGGFRLGCDLGRYEILVPGTMGSGAAGGSSPLTSSAFTSSALERVSAASVNPLADTVFRVAPGQKAIGVMVYSLQGTPNALLIGPDGTRYPLTSDLADGSSTPDLSGTFDNQQVGIIQNPAPGNWFVRPAPGSARIDKVTTYVDLPAPRVSSSLNGATVPTNGSMSVDYSFADIPGQVVNFVERDANGAVVGQLGSVASPTVGRPEVRRADLLPPPRSGGLLGIEPLGIVSTGTSTGTLNYQSSAAADGGLYQVVALVEQDGLPRDEIVLGSYQIAPATKAAPPTSVVATATADGASISWQPPTSDGGRRITGYRLSTSKGFPVWFDADARSGELPIPSMNPGDSVDVYVQAITSAGPGQDGVGSFVATGTTGPVYEQTFRDLQLPNPSSVARPESIPTATADDIPTNISPPDAPGSVVQPPVVTTPTGPTVPVPNPLPNLPTTGGNSMWPAMLAVLLVMLGLLARSVAGWSRRRQVRRLTTA